MMEYRVYVGTYTDGNDAGVWTGRLNVESGALHLTALPHSGVNPSFVAVHPSGRYLYAVNELEQGAVSAFARDPESGRLTFLNRQPSGGAHPCHLAVDAGGRYVFATNYTGGSVAVLSIEPDGSLGPATDHVEHSGSGVDPRRQDRAHPHSIWLSPAGELAYVPDLGLDRIMQYRVDYAQGRLVPDAVPWTQVQPGAGPRHLAFHPTGRFAYVINELNSSITAFSRNPATGALTEIGTVTTLPEGFCGENTCADIHVHPSGQFVYGSNRGHDSIAVYRVDPDNGSLTLVGHQPTGGQAPRNFALDPTGAILLAANQLSGTIVTFRIDQETGRLAPTGHVAEAPRPVCIQCAGSK